MAGNQEEDRRSETGKGNRIMTTTKPWTLVIVLLLLAFAAAATLSACGATEGPGTTGATETTTTLEPATSTTAPEPTTSTDTEPTTSTSTTASSGPPGDSAGTWTAIEVPATGGRAVNLAVSEDALLIQSESGGQFALTAYLLDSGEVIELPVESPQVGWVDVDGKLAVWTEGTYDEATDSFVDQHVFAYSLPGGPKVDVTPGASSPVYPQVAEGWASWVEISAPEGLSDEYREMSIFGVRVDQGGVPTGEPVELVPSAIASVVGDTFWTYSLSATKLAWEQGVAANGIEAGIYLMDLGTLETTKIGAEGWRPSLAGDLVVYTDSGLKSLNTSAGLARELDARGDYAAAASSFAAYFRPEDDGGYEIVARGLTGQFEQVLGQPSEPPWLAAGIAASDRHVAFIVDGSARLFRWQPRP